MRVVFRYANDAEVISYKNGTPRSVIVADYKEWLKARAVAEWYVLEGWYDDDRTSELLSDAQCDRRERPHGGQRHGQTQADVSFLGVGLDGDQEPVS